LGKKINDGRKAEKAEMGIGSHFRSYRFWVTFQTSMAYAAEITVECKEGRGQPRLNSFSDHYHEECCRPPFAGREVKDFITILSSFTPVIVLTAFLNRKYCFLPSYRCNKMQKKRYEKREEEICLP